MSSCLAFRGSVRRGLANSRGRPKQKVKQDRQCKYKRNIEARLCDHCCRRKGIITCSSRINKANGVFVELYPVWRNHNMSKNFKTGTFNTNVKSVLLYACEIWKTTNQITKSLQIFINKCLRRIMNVKWTDKITNEKLWRITKQKPIEIQLKRRKWDWIGHTLRKEAGAIEKTALDWNP